MTAVEVCAGTGTPVAGPRCRACDQEIALGPNDLTYPTHLRVRNTLVAVDDRLYCSAHGLIATGDTDYIKRMVAFHVKDGHAVAEETLR